MKWMRERDLLIAQTMAFVESVTGKKPDGDKPLAFAAPDVRASSPTMPEIETILAETISNPQPPKPIHVPRVPQRSEYENEIKARVANFRAHQQRFLREREEYGSTTMAKVQQALQDLPPRPEK